METANAGLYIEDSELNPEILKEELINLISNKEKLFAMQTASKNLAKYDGVEQIAQQIKNASK